MGAQPVFTSQLPWKTGRKVETLVINCSAWDFRPYFAEFAEKYLKFTEYDHLAVPGGIQILSMASFFVKLASMMMKWVEFLVTHHGLKKIVILGHDDCSWYKDFRFGPIHVDLKKRQIDDLLAVAQMLRSKLNIAVEIYFAQPQADGKVVFSAIS